MIDLRLSTLVLFPDHGMGSWPQIRKQKNLNNALQWRLFNKSRATIYVTSGFNRVR